MDYLLFSTELNSCQLGTSIKNAYSRRKFFNHKLFGFDGYWYKKMQYKQLKNNNTNNNEDQMVYLQEQLIQFIEKSLIRTGLFKNKQEIISRLFGNIESNYKKCLELLSKYCTKDFSFPQIYTKK